MELLDFVLKKRTGGNATSNGESSLGFWVEIGQLAHYSRVSSGGWSCCSPGWRDSILLSC